MLSVGMSLNPLSFGWDGGRSSFAGTNALSNIGHSEPFNSPIVPIFVLFYGFIASLKPF